MTEDKKPGPDAPEDDQQPHGAPDGPVVTEAPEEGHHRPGEGRTVTTPSDKYRGWKWYEWDCVKCRNKNWRLQPPSRIECGMCGKISIGPYVKPKMRGEVVIEPGNPGGWKPADEPKNKESALSAKRDRKEAAPRRGFDEGDEED